MASSSSRRRNFGRWKHSGGMSEEPSSFRGNLLTFCYLHRAVVDFHQRATFLTDGDCRGVFTDESATSLDEQILLRLFSGLDQRPVRRPQISQRLRQTLRGQFCESSSERQFFGCYHANDSSKGSQKLRAFRAEQTKRTANEQERVQDFKVRNSCGRIGAGATHVREGFLGWKARAGPEAREGSKNWDKPERRGGFNV